LGYNVVQTKLVVDPDEAEQVRQCFRLYLEYEGLIPVVQELERRGWRTKRWTTAKGTQRGGRPFDKNSLWYLLTNITYLGKLRYKDEIYEGEHDAIIVAELWQQVQTKLQRNGQPRRAGPPAAALNRARRLRLWHELAEPNQHGDVMVLAIKSPQSGISEP
jgi:site-specific DNA recombinase